jgi:hypothetical protein
MNIPAVSFVGPNNIIMSSLVAQKMNNLNPIPSEIVFITPDVEKLKFVHDRMLNTFGIPVSYISDMEASRIVGMSPPMKNLGWLHRQWIQLHLDLILPDNKYILTCDSDLVVNRYLDLFINSKINYFVETESYYEPYFRSIRILLPDLKIFLPQGESFNSEIMVLDIDEIKALRKEMNTSLERWVFVAHKNLIPGQCYAFSEYETIGTWMINRAKHKINLTKSDTYEENNRFGDVGKKFKLSELLKNKCVIPLRCMTDKDISWFE